MDDIGYCIILDENDIVVDLDINRVGLVDGGPLAKPGAAKFSFCRELPVLGGGGEEFVVEVVEVLLIVGVDREDNFVEESAVDPQIALIIIPG